MRTIFLSLIVAAICGAIPGLAPAYADRGSSPEEQAVTSYRVRSSMCQGKEVQYYRFLVNIHDIKEFTPYPEHKLVAEAAQAKFEGGCMSEWDANNIAKPALEEFNRRVDQVFGPIAYQAQTDTDGVSAINGTLSDIWSNIKRDHGLTINYMGFTPPVTPLVIPGITRN